jgi:hypothetical protein
MGLPSRSPLGRCRTACAADSDSSATASTSAVATISLRQQRQLHWKDCQDGRLSRRDDVGRDQEGLLAGLPRHWNPRRYHRAREWIRLFARQERDDRLEPAGGAFLFGLHPQKRTASQSPRRHERSSTDPLVSKQIEVIHGPATLRWGSQFAVIRDAIRDKAMVALGRVVLSRCEHVEAFGKGILAMILRYSYEVRDQAPYFEDISDLKLRPRTACQGWRVRQSSASCHGSSPRHWRSAFR